ncbi:MAG TPA: stringent starvation protein A [Methylophaga aminisulfidivorans]|uniref:glutathione S-transferase N-terminal domain-containing protein n=1 Tax=Methylophaga TaxID=40222 RepID=UPI00176826F1|nr:MULTISPECIES: glutathione S-transferase N-terminal domain-containing protein [Methylophaga]HIC45670.1 stringent starvation protein A [Methylophaga sp.]HIM40134.1 stringent starvation protein A [Methylophaga aminisulfidivorans]
MNSTRRSKMTVFSDPICPFSHQVRIILQEKDIDANIETLIDGAWPEEVAIANPYGIGPTLFDRDLVLFNAGVIAEYLDERFPHPPLMPVDPVAKAKTRLMLYRIDRDWYSHWNVISGREKGNVSKARKTIQEDLTVLAPLFEDSAFFMSDEFSVLDCTLAPLLWRLPALKIKLPASASAVEKYAQKIFRRDSFQQSLTAAEKAMR